MNKYKIKKKFLKNKKVKKSNNNQMTMMKPNLTKIIIIKKIKTPLQKK